MPEISTSSLSTDSLWKSLVSLLLSDPKKLIDLLRSVAQYVQARFPREGLYEVLDLDVRLELLDQSGHDAIYHKREKVRFLQNNIIAFQDQAWGEGDIFADYKCSPGIPVDCYQEGYRYRILISLRQTKNRGDIEEFQIERRIRDGFAMADGSFQTNVDHRMQKLSISVAFPAERKPVELIMAEQRAERTTRLGEGHTRQLANGNWLVEWSSEKPRRFESYILRWKWKWGVGSQNKSTAHVRTYLSATATAHGDTPFTKMRTVVEKQKRRTSHTGIWNTYKIPTPSRYRDYMSFYLEWQ